MQLIIISITFFQLQVPETEDEACRSDYNEFTKLLISGKRVADETKRTFSFIWRGYKACISHQVPKLTTFELERRFKLAMDFIHKSAKEQKKVHLKYIYIYRIQTLLNYINYYSLAGFTALSM